MSPDRSGKELQVETNRPNGVFNHHGMVSANFAKLRFHFAISFEESLPNATSSHLGSFHGRAAIATKDLTVYFMIQPYYYANPNFSLFSYFY